MLRIRSRERAPLFAALIGVAVTTVVTLLTARAESSAIYAVPLMGLTLTYVVFSALRGEIEAHASTLTRLLEEKQRAELAFREADMRARRIMDSNVMGIVFGDGRGTISDANDAFLKIVGCTREDLIAGKVRWSELTPLEYRALDEKALEDLITKGLETPYEKEYLAKDGTRVPVLVATTRLEGQEERYISFVMDLTERRKVERERSALLAREQEARAEAETLNRIGRIVSAELDLEKLLESVTSAATELSGAQVGAFFSISPGSKTQPRFELQALSGIPKSAIGEIPPPALTSLLQATFSGEGILRIADVVADKRYGRSTPHHGIPLGHFPVRSYLAVPVSSRSGTILGALLLGHSETNRFTERHERVAGGIAAQAAIAIDNARLHRVNQDALREAEAANRTKDEFLAIVSHELRTPLNAILGWAQLLRTGKWQPNQLAHGLTTVERNAKAQAQLIDDLLDVSRITSGKLRLDIQKVEPLLVIEAALETVAPAAEAKGIQIARAIDPATRPVTGDSGRLQQVVWNLLSNAIKFTPKGGRVEVSLAETDGQVEIAVSDTGQGIKPEFLPHVFDRFRQADASSTRQHGGLGLGLAIVRHLVELHGGTVTAESPGVGGGAKFRVRLPATEPMTESGLRRSAKPSKEPLPPRALEGISIVVVDDEIDARDLLETILSAASAQVYTACNSREALELVKSKKPDLLISDIGMPGEDGYALIHRVRELSPGEGGTLPAVALTAFVRGEDRRRAIREGFQMHIAKPVEAEELIAAAANLTRRAPQRARD